MNRKIFFDLDPVDPRLFVDKLRSVGLYRETPYYIEIFVVPFDREIAKNFLKKRFSHRRESSDLLFLIKTIPFVLYSTEDMEKKLKSLFIDIVVSVTYADLGYYSVDGYYYVDGECYSKAFCVEVNRGGFFI
jgi:hypothetical protein